MVEDKILQVVDLTELVVEQSMIETQQDFQEVANGKDSTDYNQTGTRV